jgi:hypothetical protein
MANSRRPPRGGVLGGKEHADKQKIKMTRHTSAMSRDIKIMGTIGRSLPLEEDIVATLKLLGVMRAHKVRPLCICVGGGQRRTTRRHYAGAFTSILVFLVALLLNTEGDALCHANGRREDGRARHEARCGVGNPALNGGAHVGRDVLVLSGGRGGRRAGERGRRAGQLAREPLLGAAPEPQAVSKLQLPRG